MTPEQRIATVASVAGAEATKNYLILMNSKKKVMEGDIEVTKTGSDMLKTYTSNLKDSTGIALYSPGGVLRTYIPTKKASVPKKTTGLQGVSREPKWGIDELKRVIEQGAARYKSGYHLVIFSAMPYAGIVNNITSPYFGRIKTLATMEIKEIMRIYKNITANPV